MGRGSDGALQFSVLLLSLLVRACLSLARQRGEVTDYRSASSVCPHGAKLQSAQLQED